MQELPARGHQLTSMVWKISLARGTSDVTAGEAADDDVEAEGAALLREEELRSGLAGQCALQPVGAELAGRDAARTFAAEKR